VGAELFHADGRTDTTNLIVAFRNFAEVLNIESVIKQHIKKLRKKIL